MLARPQLRRTLLPALVAALLALFPAAAAALTVTKTADTNDGVCDADCSLREAIADTAAGGLVSIPASAAPYEVTDGLGSLVIDKDLTIAGAGARTTEVTAPGGFARPFTIEGTGLGIVEVAIRGLSITGGDGLGGGQSGQGGGVLAFRGPGAISGPHLTLARVRVAANKATVSGGAQAVGGGVDADGPGTHLHLEESLVVGNQAIGASGGEATGGGVATFAEATATIENTTVSGNEAIGEHPTNPASSAGGVFAGNDSALVNVTLFGNSASASDPQAAPSVGGNLGGAGFRVRSTIVAGGKAETAATADCNASFAGEGGNVLGTGCTLGPGDVFTGEPLLGPLADNGGETDTMALLAGSPALEHGIGCLAVDQRGVTRPQGAACDAGAFELQRVQVPAGPSPKAQTNYFCKGRRATMVGGNGRDVIVGSAGADVIVARGGSDEIKARAGNDVVCAGAGADKLIGGAGRDRLYAEKGADKLLGGPGKDALVGGPGKDHLRGGPGRDAER